MNIRTALSRRQPMSQRLHHDQPTLASPDKDQVTLGERLGNFGATTVLVGGMLGAATALGGGVARLAGLPMSSAQIGLAFKVIAGVSVGTAVLSAATLKKSWIGAGE